jgi:hypothetical protein
MGTTVDPMGCVRPVQAGSFFSGLKRVRSAIRAKEEGENEKGVVGNNIVFAGNVVSVHGLFQANVLR